MTTQIDPTRSASTAPGHLRAGDRVRYARQAAPFDGLAVVTAIGDAGTVESIRTVTDAGVTYTLADVTLDREDLRGTFPFSVDELERIRP